MYVCTDYRHEVKLLRRIASSNPCFWQFSSTINFISYQVMLSYVIIVRSKSFTSYSGIHAIISIVMLLAAF
jgi:hypothetical protein